MLGNLLKAAVVAELGAVAGGYYVFHKLNTDVQFRGWVADTCPSCLDGFCTAVTSFGYPLPPDLLAFRDKINTSSSSSSSSSGKGSEGSSGGVGGGGGGDGARA